MTLQKNGVKKMLNKEECIASLAFLYAMAQITVKHHNGKHKFTIVNDFDLLTQLINEHFELVKKNESLSIQLVEYQRVCQLKQLRINELEKGTVSYVD